MQAIILAGGLGTRLRSVLKAIPKPMAPIGDKPFLAFLLAYLKEQGILEVILSVSYKYEVIQEYFKETFCGMRIVYNIEKELLGTGGAIKDSLKFVDSSVYVLNGDTFFAIALKELQLGESKVCIALKSMKHFDRYGAVRVNSAGFVTAFEEKAYCSCGLINGGIYHIRKDIFEGFNLQGNFSFERFLQENCGLLQINTKVYGDNFIDIGIPSDYELFVKEHKRFIQNIHI